MDIILDAFEASWKKGLSPVVGEYAGIVELRYQKRLLRELVLVERECFKFLDLESKKDKISQSDTIQTNSLETLDSSPVLKRESKDDLPTHFDRFAILGLLGRGSHGVVYKAEDLEIRRRVALKIAYSATSGDTSRAFAAEAANASRVDHPSIVRIMEVGDFRGTHFMVSELIEGASLTEIVVSQTLNDIACSQIVAAIASGVDAAHRCGVIHRDLKPSNIMMEFVGGTTEPQNAFAEIPFTQDNFRVRILDFGIAKMLDRVTRRTLQGDIVGTPHYMSPEQAAGNSANVDQRSDIFSLGVILFELLTGKLPFDGSEAVVVSGIRDLKVPSIRSFRSDVPKALEHIAHKCLERNPAHRYQSAAALELELRQWLAGEKPLVLRRRERQRLAFSLASIVLLCLLMGTGVLLSRNGWLNWQRPVTQSESNSALATWLNAGSPDSLLAWIESSERNSASSLSELHEMRDSRLWEDSQRWRIEFAELCLSEQSGLNSDDMKRLAGHIIESLEPDYEKSWSQVLLAAPDDFVREVEPREGLELKRSQRQTLFGIVSSRWEKSANVEGLMRLLRFSQTEELSPVVPNLVKCIQRADAEVKQALCEEFDQTELKPGALPSEDANRWRAKLALIAYGLEDWERVDQVLSYSRDPRARNYFLYWFWQCNLNIEPLLNRFADYQDDWRATAVLGCLSTIPSTKISDRLRAVCSQLLIAAYKNHPSSGVHSLARTLLLEWGMENLALAAEAEEDFRKITMDRNWYVNPSGMQMNIVRGPKEFWFGATKSAKELQRGNTHRIEHSFAVAERMVSEREYARFDPDKFQVPTDAPATGVTWFEAVRFCDWMNHKEGFEESPSIEFVDETSFRFTESLDGYRLMSVWEWECYFRAGTETEFSFGDRGSEYSCYLFEAKQSSKRTFGPICDEAIRLAIPEWISTPMDLLLLFPPREFISPDNYAIAKRGSLGDSNLPVIMSNNRIGPRNMVVGYGFRLSRRIR